MKALVAGSRLVLAGACNRIRIGAGRVAAGTVKVVLKKSARKRGASANFRTGMVYRGSIILFSAR
jgi:hypothetical protein